MACYRTCRGLAAALRTGVGVSTEKAAQPFRLDLSPARRCLLGELAPVADHSLNCRARFNRFVPTAAGIAQGRSLRHCRVGAFGEYRQRAELPLTSLRPEGAGQNDPEGLADDRPGRGRAVAATLNRTGGKRASRRRGVRAQPSAPLPSLMTQQKSPRRMAGFEGRY